MLVGCLESVVHIISLTAHEHNFCLARPDGQMRQLRQVVPEDDALDEVAWYLLGAVGLVQEQEHALVIVR